MTVENRVWARKRVGPAESIVASGLSAAAAPICALAWTQRLGVLLGEPSLAAGVTLAAFVTGLTLAAIRGMVARRDLPPLSSSSGAATDSRQRPAQAGGCEIAAGLWTALTPWLLGLADFCLPGGIAARTLLAGALLVPATTLVARPMLAGIVPSKPGQGDAGGRTTGLSGYLLGSVAGTVCALAVIPAAGVQASLAVAAALLLASGTLRRQAARRAATMDVSGERSATHRCGGSGFLGAVWGLSHLALVGLVAIAYPVAVCRLADGESAVPEPPMAVTVQATRLRGLVPALLSPHPRRVAALGLGDGRAVSGVAALSEVEQIDCAEAGSTGTAAAKWLEDANRRVLQDRRLRVIRQDARTFLRTAPDAYDLILAETVRPRVACASGRLTAEYFRACASRLRPDGLLAQWMATETLSRHELGRVLTTFQRVFPQTTLWRAGRGPDLLLLGSRDASRVHASRIAQRIRQNREAAAIVRALGWEHPLSLLCLYTADTDELATFAAGTGMLTDNRPLLDPAGLWGLSACCGHTEGEEGLEALLHLRSSDLPTLIAYDRDPRRDPRFHYALGLGFEGIGDYRSAGTALLEALRLDGGLSPARTALARVMARVTKAERDAQSRNSFQDNRASREINLEPVVSK